MDKVTIHCFGPTPGPGAHVVAAFPSVGLVATIAANHLVEQLGLEQIGVMDSPKFPTLSVIEHGVPMDPVRIYAGQGLVVFISEFQPNPQLVRPISEAIVRWCIDQKAASLIAPEGLVTDEDSPPECFVAASTSDARGRMDGLGAQMFEEGIVAGVTGVLLNLGRRDAFDVIAILAEAHQGEPDARSAVAIVDWVGRMIGAEVPVTSLLEEADAFDGSVDAVERRMRAHGGHAELGDQTMFG